MAVRGAAGAAVGSMVLGGRRTAVRATARAGATALALATLASTASASRGEIEVTSSSPVEVIGAEALAERGLRPVAELLKDLPTCPVPDAAGGPGNVDLRGLGTGRTLVLVNGRRVQANTGDGNVDLSSIPSQLVDRVEVLRDGASAVYGSDACGGVVNVILKKDAAIAPGDGGSAVLGDVYDRLSALRFGFDGDTVCTFGAGAPTPPLFLWRTAPPAGLPTIGGSVWTWPTFGPATSPVSPVDPAKAWLQSPAGGEPAPAGSAAAPAWPKSFEGWSVPPWSVVQRAPECPDATEQAVKPLYLARDQARADWAYYSDFARQPNRAPSDQAADQAKADEARGRREGLDAQIRELLAGCAPGAKPATPAAVPTPTPSGGGIDTFSLDLGPRFKGRLDYYPNLFGSEWPLPGPGVTKNTTLGAGEGPVRKMLGGTAAEYRFADLGLDPLPIPAGATATGGTSDWSIGGGLRIDWGQKKLALKLDYAPREQVVVELDRPPAAGTSGAFGGIPPALQQGLPQSLAPYAWQGFYVGSNAYLSFGAPASAKLDPELLKTIPGYRSVEPDLCAEEAMPPLAAASSAGGALAARIGLDGTAPAGGAPVVIGVVDTGIDWNHAGLDWSSLWRNEGEVPNNGIDDDHNGYVDDVIGWDFVGASSRPWDYDGHGTFVAGILAASHSGDAAGVSPGAKLMILKALNGFGHARASNVAQAIVYGADNGAKILNLSLAGPGLPKVAQRAIAYAQSKGVLVVVAAGNDGREIAGTYPAALAGVLTVAAVDANDHRAAFSSYGEAVAIAAPGTDIVSLRARRTDFQLGRVAGYRAGEAFVGSDRRAYRASGTSFAAPIVSGVAALVWAKTPALTAAEVRQKLEQTARDVETPGRDLYTGYGVIDARAALAEGTTAVLVAEILDASPVQDGDAVLVEVTGTARADRFRRAWLEIGEGESPSTWKKVGAELSTAVEGGALGRIPAAELAGAKVWTLRLVVEHEDGKTREARYLLRLG